MRNYRLEYSEKWGAYHHESLTKLYPAEENTYIWVTIAEKLTEDELSEIQCYLDIHAPNGSKLITVKNAYRKYQKYKEKLKGYGLQLIKQVQ